MLNIGCLKTDPLYGLYLECSKRLFPHYSILFLEQHSEIRRNQMITVYEMKAKTQLQRC